MNRYDVIASKAGGSMNAQRLRRENFGSDFATQMEMADGYALREKALLENRLRREVYNPLAASGIDKEDLATVLKNNRILNERTATGAAIEANPAEARALHVDGGPEHARSAPVESGHRAGGRCRPLCAWSQPCRNCT